MGFIGDDKSISSNTNISMVIAYFLCKVCLRFLYYVKLHILYIFIHSLENIFSKFINIFRVCCPYKKLNHLGKRISAERALSLHAHGIQLKKPKKLLVFMGELI